MKRVIYLASDHAGFNLKEKIRTHLARRFLIKDFGAFSLNKKDDYPDFIISCVEQAMETNSLAIVLGGSGQGEAIAANKVKEARAVVIYNFNKKIIKLSKEHNNANVLSLGVSFLNKENAQRMVKLWLDTNFSREERHVRRIEKITKIEQAQ